MFHLGMWGCGAEVRQMAFENKKRKIRGSYQQKVVTNKRKFESPSYLRLNFCIFFSKNLCS
jgi:stalled ribosome alternative rescue factor ArfA